MKKAKPIYVELTFVQKLQNEWVIADQVYWNRAQNFI